MKNKILWKGRKQKQFGKMFHLKKLNPGTRRMVCLILAMASGTLSSCISVSGGEFINEYIAKFIPFLLMTMLFSAFINVQFKRESLALSHLWMLLFMAGLATAAYFFILFIFGIDAQNFAIMAFLIAMTPTANAAPVITELLRRRSDYVTISVVGTNVWTAIVLAPLIALVMGVHLKIDTVEIAWKTISIIGTPLLLSIIVRVFFKKLTQIILKYKFVSFYLWMLMLFIICSQSSLYIIKQNISWTIIFEISLVASILCVLNFGLGYFIGEKNFKRECSQSLGQKNTMIMLWIAVAFFDPIVALGPIFYVICHNLWNSIQLRQSDKNKTTIQ